MSDPISHDPQSLFDPLDAPNSVTTLYTSPSGAGKRGTRVQGIWVCNHTGGAVTYTLHHVKTGRSATDSNKLYDVLSIAANATQILAQGIILDPGDFFSHLAGAVTSISVHGYGWEMTD